MKKRKFYTQEETNEMIMADIPPLVNYKNKLVMYLMRVDNRFVKGHVVVKIGRTDDIERRFNELNSKYGGVSLIEFGYIRNNSDENVFHVLEKYKHPKLKCQMRINNEKKKELYIFCDTIYNEYRQVIHGADGIQYKSYTGVQEINVDEIIFDENVEKLRSLIKESTTRFVQYAHEINRRF